MMSSQRIQDSPQTLHQTNGNQFNYLMNHQMSSQLNGMTSQQNYQQSHDPVDMDLKQSLRTLTANSSTNRLWTDSLTFGDHSTDGVGMNGT